MSATRTNEPKVLLFDIEVTPNVGMFWDPKIPSGYINHENILDERYIICIAWKWLGSEKVHSASILSHPAKYGLPDGGVLRKFHGVASQADCLIAQNGDKFDVPWVRTRLMLTTLPPLKPIPTIDTKKMAMKMKFNSNALAYLAKFFALGEKIKTDLDLWKRVLRGEKKAVEEMVAYNRQDVSLLESFYLKIRPHVPALLNRQHWSSDRMACPACGKPELQSRGRGMNRATVYQRMQCQACGAWCSKPMNSTVAR